MVNPGAFQGARKVFLMGEKEAYSQAVDDGYVAEAIAKIQRRFSKRFPIDLPENEDPTPEQLAAVDDEEIEPDYPEPDAEKLSKEDYDAAMMVVEERRRKLAFQRSQIKRWMAYQHMKDHNIDSKASGAHNPYCALLYKLTGQQFARPRTKIPSNVWRKTQREAIENIVKVRALQLSTPKSGMAALWDKVAKEMFGALWDKVAKEMFGALSDEQRKHWRFIVEQETQAAQTAWEEEVNSKPSTAPEDRQRCILGLVRFIQPVLDLVCEATGWKASFIAGGPEPAHEGRLHIISVHSGKTTGDVPLDFGALACEGYKKNFLLMYGRFLKKCYSVEECHSRALKPDDSISLEATEVDKEGAGLYCVDEPGESQKPTAPSCLPPQAARKAPKGKKSRPTTTAPVPVIPASVPAPRPHGPAHTPALVLTTPPPASAHLCPTPRSPSPPSQPRVSSEPRHREPPSPPQSPIQATFQPLPPTLLPDFPHGLSSESPSCPPAPPLSLSLGPRTPPSLTPQTPPSQATSPFPSRAMSPPPSLGPPPPPSPARSSPPSPPPSAPPSPPPSTSRSLMDVSPDTATSSSAASLPLLGSPADISTGNTRTVPSSPDPTSVSQVLRRSKRRRSVGSSDVLPRPAKRGKTVKPSQAVTNDGLVASPPSDHSATPLPITVDSQAPSWFTSIVGMLQGRHLDTDECWIELVRKWADFEAQEGYEGTKRLSADSRPDVIALWLHCKRSVNYQPEIDLRRYPKAYMVWWTAIQPEWRVSRKKIVHDQVDGDWEALRRAGVNGLVNVLVALFYWGCAVKEGRKSDKNWKLAVGDCSTAITQLLARS